MQSRFPLLIHSLPTHSIIQLYNQFCSLKSLCNNKLRDPLTERNRQTFLLQYLINLAHCVLLQCSQPQTLKNHTFLLIRLRNEIVATFSRYFLQPMYFDKYATFGQLLIDLIQTPPEIDPHPSMYQFPFDKKALEFLTLNKQHKNKSLLSVLFSILWPHSYLAISRQFSISRQPNLSGQELYDVTLANLIHLTDNAKFIQDIEPSVLISNYLDMYSILEPRSQSEFIFWIQTLIRNLTNFKDILHILCPLFGVSSQKFPQIKILNNLVPSYCTITEYFPYFVELLCKTSTFHLVNHEKQLEKMYKSFLTIGAANYSPKSVAYLALFCSHSFSHIQNTPISMNSFSQPSSQSTKSLLYSICYYIFEFLKQKDSNSLELAHLYYTNWKSIGTFSSSDKQLNRIMENIFQKLDYSPSVSIPKISVEGLENEEDDEDLLSFF